MTPQQIHANRSLIAFILSNEVKVKLPDIREILKCDGPEDVRRCIANGRRLRRKLDELTAAAALKSENEALQTFLQNVPAGGGNISRPDLERLVRESFRGGMATLRACKPFQI